MSKTRKHERTEREINQIRKDSKNVGTKIALAKGVDPDNAEALGEKLSEEIVSELQNVLKEDASETATPVTVPATADKGSQEDEVKIVPANFGTFLVNGLGSYLTIDVGTLVPMRFTLVADKGEVQLQSFEDNCVLLSEVYPYNELPPSLRRQSLAGIVSHILLQFEGIVKCCKLQIDKATFDMFVDTSLEYFQMTNHSEKFKEANASLDKQIAEAEATKAVVPEPAPENPCNRAPWADIWDQVFTQA